MNPLFSRSYSFLIFTNALAFLCWNVRTYLINWYVLETTNSTFFVGLFASLPAIAGFFVAPYGGKLADNYSKKTILLIGRIVIFISYLLLILGIMMDFYTFFCITISFIIYGIAGSIEVVSARSLILDIVGFKYLTLGNSVLEFATSFLNTLGPISIAIIFATFESTTAFISLPILGGISVITATLLFFSFKESKDQENEIKKNENKSVKEGLIYAYKNINIRFLLIIASTIFFWAIPQPLIPKITKDVLNSGTEIYALLISLGGFGAMLGLIILSLKPKIFRNSKFIAFSICIYSLTMMIFVLSKSILLSSILLIISSLAHSIWFTVIIILLQTLPDKVHKGRVMGLFFTVIQFYGLGFIVGGFLGELVGIIWTVCLSSIFLILINLIPLIVSKEYRGLKS